MSDDTTRPKPHDSVKDVAEGLIGAFGMILAFVTPMLRRYRSHWGLDAATANRDYPGDDLVPEPQWQWTHGVEIEAPMDEVWPWVAQIGQDKGGFYSYQFLENLVRCDVDNADRIHVEWTDVNLGDPLRLHPDMPPLHVAAVEPGRWYVVRGGDLTGEQPDVAVSWLFFVERIHRERTRFISRFRTTYGDERSERLMYGPLVTEPVGFVMDRKMLLGVRRRAERAHAGIEALGEAGAGALSSEDEG